MSIDLFKTDFDALETRIVSGLTELVKSAPADDVSKEALTLRLKLSLKSIGSDFGYEIATGGLPDSEWGEWVYEMVWYKNHDLGDDSVARLKEIGLVMETQWETDFASVLYDFEKILQARSFRKLLIFQCNQFETAADYVTRFAKSIEEYVAPKMTERYVFAIYDKPQGKFHFAQKVMGE